MGANAQPMPRILRYSPGVTPRTPRAGAHPRAHSKDLVAASATPLVLSILEGGDSYGYGIIQQIAEASDGRMQWAEGMLYPILHRLEKQGLVKSYWGQAESGRKRKYYSLRRPGRVALNQQRQSWSDVFALLQSFKETPACSS